MYAIFIDGGRQFKVSEGEEVEIDFRDLPAGETITFDKILAYSDDDGAKIGQPTLEGSTITAEVVGASQGKKLIVRKFRRRKNSRRKTGHRQLYTKLKINKITIA